MRPAKVVIDVREGQLVAQALFAFTEGDHAPSDGGYMLVDGEVEALNEGRVDLPAVGSQHVLHGSSGVEHHAVPHAHYSAAAIGLDHLGIEELRRICRKFHFEALWGKISFAAAEDHTRGSATMVSFKGTHFVKDIILTCVRWYVAYPLSYRHVEELMQERGVWVDHSTVNRWFLKYSPQLEAAFHCRKRPVWLS